MSVLNSINIIGSGLTAQQLRLDIVEIGRASCRERV